MAYTTQNTSQRNSRSSRSGRAVAVPVFLVAKNVLFWGSMMITGYGIYQAALLAF